MEKQEKVSIEIQYWVYTSSEMCHWLPISAAYLHQSLYSKQDGDCVELREFIQSIKENVFWHIQLPRGLHH